jgi:hypothetical protein
MEKKDIANLWVTTRLRAGEATALELFRSRDHVN